MKEERLSLRRHALYFAWVIALSGFCISVFFGEVLLNEPCPLCWYQRIALFPLALLLGIGAYRNDQGIARYAFPLASLGALVALFQIFEKYFPVLQKSGVCKLGATCENSPFALFGVIDFPTLSAAGFVAIAALLIAVPSKKK